MKLILGLGNTGLEYIHTRHNLGFIVLDQICLKYNGSFNYNKKLNSEIASVKFKSCSVILAKPQTYMNNSGHAAVAIMNYYKIHLDNVFVIHDELDLSDHIVKIKKGGGNAGHNGLKSISTLCGNDYTRIRYGIGKPDKNSHISVSEYVLSQFSNEDLKTIQIKSDIISENLDMLFDYELCKLIGLLN